MKIGSCIIKAREFVGVTQRELAERCGIQPSEICQIENGRVIPRFDRVERFASALGMSVIEMLSFDLDDMPRHASPQSKSSNDYQMLAGNLRSASAAIALVTAADTVEGAANIDRMVSTRLKFPGNRRLLNGAAVSLAEKMRKSLGLGMISNVDFEELLLISGVRVLRAKFSTKVQSVAIWSARRRRLSIVLNEDNTQERDRFRLAFDLAVAHIFFASKSVVDVNHVVNHRFLKEFTAAFLMPAESIRNLVASRGIAPSGWTFDQLISLKTIFAVSAESFALRLDELGLISNELRLKFREQIQKYYKEHPSNFEPTFNKP